MSNILQIKAVTQPMLWLPWTLICKKSLRIQNLNASNHRHLNRGIFRLKKSDACYAGCQTLIWSFCPRSSEHWPGKSIAVIASRSGLAKHHLIPKDWSAGAWHLELVLAGKACKTSKSQHHGCFRLTRPFFGKFHLNIGEAREDSSVVSFRFVGLANE